MKVYKATVIDKCASPSWEEPVSYDSYVAVATLRELKEGASKFLPAPYTDEDIHFYFNIDDWGEGLDDGDSIECEEFDYLIGERVA